MKIGKPFLFLAFVLAFVAPERDSRRTESMTVGNAKSAYRLSVPENGHVGRAFPEGFMWGVATSSFQDNGGGGKTDFDELLARQGIQPNFVGFTDDDVLLAKQYGVTYVRDSIEWGRIEPEPGVWDKEEMNRAFQKTRFMIRNGVKVMKNLNHFALPSWAAKMGGWKNDDLPALYAEYVRVVAEKFRPLGIEYWMTFNEPMPLVAESYVNGNYPPYEHGNFADAMMARRNIIHAHNLAYRVLHKTLDTPRRKVSVGIAHLVDNYAPADPGSKKDQQATASLEFTMNFDLIDALRDNLDYIGLNYYSGWRIKFNPWSFFFGNNVEYVNTRKKEDSFYPAGIYELIKKFEKYHKPIIVTENGIDDDADTKRPAFMVSHLYWIQKAANEAPADAPVIGYYSWTFLDNFEWLTNGHTAHCGFFHVDPVTKARSPRPSAFLFRDITRANGLTEDMLARAR
jgi:beta-glucosidase